MPGKIYEYAVLYHPKPDDKNKRAEPSELIVDVKRVVAENEQGVAILAAREIPVEYLDGKLDQVEIAIRPF